MTYVAGGFKKLTEVRQDVILRTRNYLALSAVESGTGKPSDVNLLVGVSNMATAISRQYGQEYRAEIRRGADAVESIRNRAVRWGKVQATPTELEAIKLLFEIHDAQLNEVTIAELHDALKLMGRKVMVL
jgi:hypothetical protein